MANYPRELFESEQQAKEQIPLLFGDMKRISASSMGSDKVEAAPTRSNRTEVTHSTNVSDQSQVRSNVKMVEKKFECHFHQKLCVLETY